MTGGHATNPMLLIPDRSLERGDQQIFQGRCDDLKALQAVLVNFNQLKGEIQFLVPSGFLFECRDQTCPGQPAPATPANLSDDREDTPATPTTGASKPRRR